MVEERELGEGTWLVRGPGGRRADDGVARRELPSGALKAQCASDSLLADPIVYTLDEGTCRATSGGYCVGNEEIRERLGVVEVRDVSGARDELELCVR